MRLICTLLILLAFLTPAQSQKITGIWRGYFVQKAYNEFTGRFMEDRYKYEVQINQLPSSAIEGVTYSYRNIVFYGKASFKGIYTKTTGNVLVKELKMLELKISGSSEPCLMTCYLDYKKDGKTETLSGTFTSVNDKKKTDCGDGTIYLEKVPESDFEKEEFLNKKDSAEKKPLPNKNAVTAKPKSNTPNTNDSKPSTSNAVKPKTVVPPAKPTIKPGAEEFVVKKGADNKANNPVPQAKKLTDSVIAFVPKIKETPAVQPKLLPPVLLERKNKLIETIEVDVKDVEVSFYDNGKIDNDTITVYLNNEKVIDYQVLGYKPIKLNLHLSEDHLTDELITVANNLGLEPPNTALMVITAGTKRYEITIASDESNNGKVIIEYKPKGIKVH